MATASSDEFKRLYSLLTSMVGKGHVNAEVTEDVHVKPTAKADAKPMSRSVSLKSLLKPISQSPLQMQLESAIYTIQSSVHPTAVIDMESDTVSTPPSPPTPPTPPSPVAVIQATPTAPTAPIASTTPMRHMVIDDTIPLDTTHTHILNTVLMLQHDGSKKKDTGKKPNMEREIHCIACLRVYSSTAAYDHHLKRATVCREIASRTDATPTPAFLRRPLNQLLHEWWMEIMLGPGGSTATHADAVNEVAVEDTDVNCRFCHKSFSTQGNLQRHFITALACNRRAFEEFKQLIRAL